MLLYKKLLLMTFGTTLVSRNSKNKLGALWRKLVHYGMWEYQKIPRIQP